MSFQQEATQLRATADQAARRIADTLGADAPTVHVDHSPIYGSPYSHLFIYLTEDGEPRDDGNRIVVPYLHISFREEMEGEDRSGFYVGKYRNDDHAENIEGNADEDVAEFDTLDEVIPWIKQRVS
jgi:hypothetical protein